MIKRTENKRRQTLKTLIFQFIAIQGFINHFYQSVFCVSKICWFKIQNPVFLLIKQHPVWKPDSLPSYKYRGFMGEEIWYFVNTILFFSPCMFTFYRMAFVNLNSNFIKSDVCSTGVEMCVLSKPPTHTLRKHCIALLNIWKTPTVNIYWPAAFLSMTDMIVSTALVSKYIKVISL